MFDHGVSKSILSCSVSSGDVIGSNALYVLSPQLVFLKLDLVVALLSEIFAIKHYVIQ